MLRRYASALDSFVDLDEELLGSDGFWPRDRLLAMDTSYTAAVERAFELRLESRVAAGATVLLKSSLNGNRRLAEDAAIGAAWNLLCSRRGEMAASEVMAFVRDRGPNIEPAYVRAGLAERLRQRGAGW